MTDTRKYIDEQFDKFFEFDTDDKSTVASVPCKLFAEYCIQQLLAANQVMREALQKISDGEYGEQDRNKECKHDKYHWEDCEQCIHEVVDAALAIKPGDIALVEVGTVANQSFYLDEILMDGNENTLRVEPGTKLYTIKNKE